MTASKTVMIDERRAHGQTAATPSRPAEAGSPGAAGPASKPAGSVSHALRWAAGAFGGVLAVGVAGACCGGAAVPLGLLLAGAGVAGAATGVGVLAFTILSVASAAVLAARRRRISSAACRAPAESAVNDDGAAPRCGAAEPGFAASSTVL